MKFFRWFSFILGVICLGLGFFISGIFYFIGGFWVLASIIGSFMDEKGFKQIENFSGDDTRRAPGDEKRRFYTTDELEKVRKGIQSQGNVFF